VNRDNTVSFQNLRLQLERMGWRATLAGCQVTVHQQLDGTLSITHGPHLLARYTADGARQSTTKTAARRAVEKTQSGKVQSRLSRLCKSRTPRGLPLSHSPDRCWLNLKPGHFTCYKNRTL
jgi:hypothetical protein